MRLFAVLLLMNAALTRGDFLITYFNLIPVRFVLWIPGYFVVGKFPQN